MNDFNEQELEKKAEFAKNETEAVPVAPGLTLEMIHSRAWVTLTMLCDETELENLLRLAVAYETGERLNDTYFMAETEQ